MDTKALGQTGLQVSELCLGTMTFGVQTSEAGAQRQLDMALEYGVNFLDTAEMYPVNPVSKETIGRTEEIIGRWINQSGKRDRYIIATKHSGEGLGYVRNGAPISAKTIADTIEGSLKRLQIDCIDLYQFHWPNRGSFAFRKQWHFDPSSQNKTETLDNMAECLFELQNQVDKGTIKHFGLSNESAWGTANWLRIADANGLPRVQSIQNEYSLMYRMADTDLAELMCNEEVSLLPYSTLATGLLTGKYRNGATPDGSRAFAGDTNLGGRRTERAHIAVEAYLSFAQERGIDPINLAYAWTAKRPFVGSVIIGATTSEQLEHMLAGHDTSVITDEVNYAINELHRAHPSPF